jgi:hypothetical protein
MRPPGGRTTTFRPEVLEADPGRTLRWLGRVLVPGLFDGEHSFTIQPAGPGRVRLTQHEEFRGLLAVPMLALIAKPTLQGFHQMNQALKSRVEQPTPPSRTNELTDTNKARRVREVRWGSRNGPRRRCCGLPGVGRGARALWAFAHGTVMLELDQRFPPGADLDAAWEAGIAAFQTG